MSLGAVADGLTHAQISADPTTTKPSRRSLVSRLCHCICTQKQGKVRLLLLTARQTSLGRNLEVGAINELDALGSLAVKRQSSK